MRSAAYRRTDVGKFRYGCSTDERASAEAVDCHPDLGRRPEKRVALPVPFGCGLDRVQAEAEKALRYLSAETATIAVNAPP
jgi:hypothetical protein